MKRLIKRTLRAFKLTLHRNNGFVYGFDLGFDLARFSRNKPIQTVVDVGANIGQSVERFLEYFPGCRVISCEPALATYEKLKRRFGSHPSVSCENIALGTVPGKLPFIADESDPGMNRIARSPAKGTIEVEIDTLDRLAARYKLGTIDLLRIDTEGYELEVLRGATELLNAGRIRFIYAECTFAKDDPKLTSFDDLRGMLEESGFAFLALYEISHSEHGFAFCNALFGL